MRKAMKCLGLALAALVWGALPAHATKYDGYVCGTSYTPVTTGGTGQHGYVFLSVWSGPGCTGTAVHTVTFCSTGGTASVCAPSYLQSEAQLLALNGALVQAIAGNIRIQAVTDNTCGTPASCGTYVSFMAAP